MSTLNQQAIGENGERTFAQYGLSQSLPLGKRWTVDATLDASSTISGKIPAGAVVNAVPAGRFGRIGRPTSTARRQASNWRLHRGDAGRRPTAPIAGRGTVASNIATPTDDTRWGLTTNLLRSLGEGKTLASSIRAYRIDGHDPARSRTYASADLALALRPLDSRWSLLERFELRHESADAGFSARNALGVPAYGARRSGHHAA